MRVGDVLNRWEYVIAGDPLCQVAEAEEQAKRGDIVLSPQAAALVHPDPLPPQSLAPPDWTALPDLASLEDSLRCYVPGAVLAWLDKGLYDWLAVLRPMSVLFVRTSGLDYTQSAIVEQLHTLVQQIQKTIYRYHGTLDRLAVDDKGTVLLILIGAPPFAHADDPLRAVRCALDLQALTDQNSSLQLAVGVTTGRVFAGPVGSETRCEYTVMGDTVNLAARLMVKAGPGNILCDFDTYRQARNQLLFDSLPPIRVKGKAGLIRVYGPQEQAPAQSPPKPDPSMLINRLAELERLQAALQSIKNGQGRILLIEGQAGVGKSRLVDELTQQAQEQGIAWLQGAGQSIEQHAPYRAWREIFSFYFDLDQLADVQERQARVQNLVQELAPDQMPRLPLLNDILNLGLPPTSLTANLDPALHQQSLLSLLLVLLQAWLRERPLIVVLEDAQWLDSLSWELTIQVAHTLVSADKPLFLLLAARPLDKHSPGVSHLTNLRQMPFTETLSLSPLNAQASSSLIINHLNLAAGGLPDALARLVYTRTGGNPLFTLELIASLRDHGLIQVTPADKDNKNARCEISGNLRHTTQAMPTTVQGLMLARIDRLPPECQMILKVGSVIGRRFSYPALHYVLKQQININNAEIDTHLSSLIALDMISLTANEPAPVYTFRQVIFQKVTYQSLLFAQRRQLHRAAAEWYELTYKPNSLEAYYVLLAHHYHQAADHERERHYARLAGERAAAQFANAEAITYLSRALELTPENQYAQRFSLLLTRESVYEFMGSNSRSR